MCEFISWIEYKGASYFLTKKELGTRHGKDLIKSLGKYAQMEIRGHGIIREYYGLERKWGKDKECRDFSTPNNFPPEVVNAIKSGLFEGLGIAKSILTDSALAEYTKMQQVAWAEYTKLAWAEYTKPARGEYKKVEQAAFWKLAVLPENRVEIWW